MCECVGVGGGGGQKCYSAIIHKFFLELTSTGYHTLPSVKIRLGIYKVALGTKLASVQLLCKYIPHSVSVRKHGRK